MMKQPLLMLVGRDIQVWMKTHLWGGQKPLEGKHQLGGCIDRLVGESSWMVKSSEHPSTHGWAALDVENQSKTELAS